MTGLSINIALLLVLTHIFFPTLRPRTIHYFTLSYYDAETGLYDQGWDDLKLVSFWIIVFTGLRAAAMDYVLTPIARWQGINKRKATIRYAEQAWLLVYYSVFWSLGMVCYAMLPYPAYEHSSLRLTLYCSTSCIKATTFSTCPPCGAISPRAP